MEDYRGNLRAFISASHSDSAYVQLLSDALRRRGIRQFDDRFDLFDDPNQSFVNVIKNRIRQADLVIVLVSERTMNSQYVTQEMSYAFACTKERDVPLIPVVISPNLKPVKDSALWKNLAPLVQMRVDPERPGWADKVATELWYHYGVERSKHDKYEEYFELYRSGNLLFAGVSLTAISLLILDQQLYLLASGLGYRSSLLIELDQCLGRMEAIYESDRSKDAAEAACDRLTLLSGCDTLLDQNAPAEDRLVWDCFVIRLHHHGSLICEQCEHVLGTLGENDRRMIEQAEKLLPELREDYLLRTADEAWEADHSESTLDFIRDTAKLLYFAESSGGVSAKIPTVVKADERLVQIAAHLQESSRLFEELDGDLRAWEYLRCLIMCYERLLNYCSAVGERKISAECAGRIAELKRRASAAETEQTAEGSAAHKGIRALLGMGQSGEGGYDVFLSHRSDDIDIAQRVYDFLHSNLREVFFDDVTLPELSKSEYRRAIMTALDHSRHFIVIVTDLEMLRDSDSTSWVRREMEAFHTEIFEGRKQNANFIILATDQVFGQILSANKSNIHIDWRNYTILRISEYRERIMSYLK